MTDTSHPTRGTSLKDQLFNADKVGWLADRIAQVHRGFDRAGFEAEVMARFPDLELKARADWMAAVLARHLPQDFAAASAVIRAALPEPLDPTLTDNDFGDFIILPLGIFVAEQGLARQDVALPLLRELTMRFSMEYPVRPFIVADPDGMMRVLTQWAEDDNYHVRRLVSEGSRPLLPWASRLGLPHDWALPLLDRLHGDKTRYVTRSVANHLNDITKNHADLVVTQLRGWQGTKRQRQGELDWMSRHALRTLVKKGHAGALSHLGFAHGVAVTAELRLPKVVQIGGTLDLVADLTPAADGKLVVDYALHFIKANGQRAAKVFKLKVTGGRAGHMLQLRKSHRLHAAATTYRLFPGLHRVDLLVNGGVVASGSFNLTAGVAG